MPEFLHELRILEQIEENPDATQADLAARPGVAIGTVNWYVKRLVAKGFIKVTQLRRRRLRYLLTPERVALRARLAVSYLEISMALYRQTRQQTTQLLQTLRRDGCQAVRLVGEGELADVVWLSCLEQGVAVVQEADPRVPTISVQGTRNRMAPVRPDKGR